MYIYITRKCHKETPCVAILNKQKYHFFFYKIGEHKGGTVPACGIGTSGRGRMWGKGVRRVTIVQILWEFAS
jgi:hypothetical protein